MSGKNKQPVQTPWRGVPRGAGPDAAASVKAGSAPYEAGSAPYGLRPALSLRPIVFFTDSPTYGLAKELSSLPKTLIKKSHKKLIA